MPGSWKGLRGNPRTIHVAVKMMGTTAPEAGLPLAIKHSVAAVIPVSPYLSIRAFFWRCYNPD
jgi:hypothetical protein